ncbi:uncharacterized protein LOC110686527 [Chenopodium quinoa]|uniref:uncharacterized protein LOC110686527 n=1 Tax=Chenopodium quinoa TaxID=63459 RepID=UPI000B76E2D1|nr:uncharacterized protein LOC110686527 [Chenopodium quinoa]
MLQTWLLLKLNHSPQEIPNAFLNFYKILLGTAANNRSHVNAAIVRKGQILSQDMSESLSLPFNVEEVKKALFDIDGNKAPRPDEVLCERLRIVLPHVIAKNQSAFVHNRFIIHNMMVCQDLVRHYNRSNAAPGCLITLDLKKAYNTVEWEFIDEMMTTLNFLRKFIELVMICVRTPKFSLMINGSLHGFFALKRGLRQGDPLFPLLFVLCVKYLSRILKVVSRPKEFDFHPRCRAVSLTHLCFADDLILCCKGEVRSIRRLMKGFEAFSRATSLKKLCRKFLALLVLSEEGRLYVSRIAYLL